MQQKNWEEKDVNVSEPLPFTTSVRWSYRIERIKAGESSWVNGKKFNDVD